MIKYSDPEGPEDKASMAQILNIYCRTYRDALKDLIAHVFLKIYIP